MREARYRERSAGAAPSSPAVRPAVRAPTPREESPAAPAESTDALCGHRSMNGRTCTREHGHDAKSHRDSSCSSR